MSTLGDCQLQKHWKTRAFLKDHGIDTPAIGASEDSSINCTFHLIPSISEKTNKRDRGSAQFQAVKRKDYIPTSSNTPSQSPQANPFAIESDPTTPQAGHLAQTKRENNCAWEAADAEKGMSATYSSKKQNFWGKSDEAWLTKPCQYQFMCPQNYFYGNDCTTYLHYMLDGIALKFFINEIEGKITN